MSKIASAKELFNSSCATNSEPFALQNLNVMMTPEFSENCILIVDPKMPAQHNAYVVIRYMDELYFRQYIEAGNKKFIVCLNKDYADIELINDFEVIGCVVQQKQLTQKALHYYHLNQDTKEMEFNVKGIADN